MRLPSAILAVLLAVLLPARGDLVHRWSFDGGTGDAPSGTMLLDSIGGAVATVRGQGATLTGTTLVLPGTTTGAEPDATISAYVDLPNGLFSSQKDLTVELWASPLSSRFGQRLLDFGRGASAGDGLGALGEWTGTAESGPPAGETAGDEVFVAFQPGASLNYSRFGLRLNGGPERLRMTRLLTRAGAFYHYVLTFADGLGALKGGRVQWYRNGVLAGTIDVPYHLRDLADVNNWLGRAQFSDLSTAHAAYDELRIYDHRFTGLEVRASRKAGPGKIFPAPSAQPDAVTMHHGQKVLIDVVANDTGGANAAKVAIAQAPPYGTATVDGAGRVLYTHTSGTPASDSFTYQVGGKGGVSAPATVTINFSTALRIDPAGLAVPATPPPTAVQLSAAFGSLAFAQPLCLASPPGDKQRLFVCEKAGRIKVIPSVTAGAPTAAVFLDLAAHLSSRGEALSSTGEQGLLGLAFHPDYAANRYFYVYYSVYLRGAAFERLSRFTARASAPNSADPASELILIEQYDEASNHNGGDLHFGPDGYLYVSVGDEGEGDDTLNNSQTITKDFCSGMLRLDVDKRPGSVAPLPHAAIKTDGGVARYAVPKDNPFVPISLGGTWDGKFNGATVANPGAVRREFWAVGLRNPWRFSFDSQTSELWEGEVGQNAYEEVNLIKRGGNYGWAFREGNHAGPKVSAEPANFNAYHAKPLYEYSHAGLAGGNPLYQGNSCTGGVVYRGTRYASLQGRYFFADYVAGHLWSLVRNGSGTPIVTRVAGQTGIAAFGTDPSNGDVLLANLDQNRIVRLTAKEQASDFPATLSATGLFADLSDLAPAPGLLPYTPNLSFWSDFASKRRWFTIPSAAGQMTWSRDGAWTFPEGTIWVKHFDLPLTRHNPPDPADPVAPARRLETRLLVKNAAGVYGVSYRWNDEQTEATLVRDEGEDFEVGVTQNGQLYTQRWHIPSRAECLACHTPQAGFALSFSTRQLNREETINGFAGNQLDLLHGGGFFSNTPELPSQLPRHYRPQETDIPVETRVRSYLAVNCANCHRAGGTAPATWDGRPELTLAQTGLINGTANDHGSDPAYKLVVPGSPARSVLWHRLGGTMGFSRMPPLGSNELDQIDTALVTDWIQNALQGPP